MSENTKSDALPTVVVTGFGLFRNYKLNSSWEAVKLLHFDDVNLITKEIPVAYEDVDNNVLHIWSNYKPTLVVHVGVSWIADRIQLETRAFGHQYDKPDIYGCTPKCNTDCSVTDSLSTTQCLNSKIDLSYVCHKINEQFQKGLISMAAVVSNDAGRYLCEYIYYNSLKQDCERTVFIHVPEISEHYSIEVIASALQFAVHTLIKQVIHN